MRALYSFVLLVVVAASAASAAKFVPEPDAIPQPPTSKAKPAPSRPPIDRFQAKGAPVPLAWSFKHAAVAVPEEESGPSISDIINQAMAEPAAPDSAGQGIDQDQSGPAAAKAAIEADGYKGVRDLAPGPDGRWTARALRGTTEITVSVGPDGSVSAN
ncbi:MAG TPA: hypothetical protein VFB13_07200 [Reyranella sp.]|jgi:hypothetical protein|nr:hypothetical protein [Reyranella sp.]